MQRCLRAHWQFMIVLKDKDLPSVWEEFHALQAAAATNPAAELGKTPTALQLGQ
jgi:hypothetical protein